MAARDSKLQIKIVLIVLANQRVEATADNAVDLPLEFLVYVSHSSAVPHAGR